MLSTDSFDLAECESEVGASTGVETYIFDFLGDELGEPLLEGLLLGGGGGETRCVGERRARCL